MIQQLSKHLFWDIDKSTFDIQKHRRWLIERVIGYGTLEDWKEITAFYGLEIIGEEAVQIRTLNKKDLNYLSVILKIPKNKFRCYSETQSANTHWNY